MTRALPRANLNSSRLIRFLADLSIVDTAESKQSFAERLGQWIDFADAITLQGAHNTSVASPSAAQSGALVALEEEFTRIRTTLVSSITQSCSSTVGETRIKLPAPKPGVGIEIATTFGPYHRFYLAHQGEMESSIRPLRTNVRQVLSKASATLKQLAALDASLDKILSARERQLLSTVPLLLERRFEQLLKAHQQALFETPQADDPAMWMEPGAWLAGFCNELQGALLAELDLRLQPIAGLINAFSNEK